MFNQHSRESRILGSRRNFTLDQHPSWTLTNFLKNRGIYFCLRLRVSNWFGGKYNIFFQGFFFFFFFLRLGLDIGLVAPHLHYSYTCFYAYSSIKNNGIWSFILGVWKRVFFRKIMFKLISNIFYALPILIFCTDKTFNVWIVEN